MHSHPSRGQVSGRPLCVQLTIQLVAGGLASICAAQTLPAPSPASQPAADAASEQVDLVLTGRAYGLGNSNSHGDTILLLWNAMAKSGGRTRIDQSGLNCMTREQELLCAPDAAGSEPVRRLLADRAALRVVSERATAVLISDDLLLFQEPANADFDLIQIMEERDRQLHLDNSLRPTAGVLRVLKNARGERFYHVHLGAGPVPPLHPNPERWEYRFMLRGSAQQGERQGSYVAVLRPYGQGPKRVALVRRLISDGGKAARPLLLSAGNELSSYRQRTGARSPLRDLDLEALGQLGYDALVPGGQELYFGVQSLRAEAQAHHVPLVATNLVYARGPQRGKPVFAPYLMRRVGNVQVAILGLVDRDVAERVADPRILDDVTVTDPFAAVTARVEELARFKVGRPDVIVALSNMRGDGPTRLIHELAGVDILVNGMNQAGRTRPARLTVDAPDRPRESALYRTPFYVAWVGTNDVDQVAITVGRHDGRLVPLQAVSTPHLVDSSLPTDEALQARVTKYVLDEGRTMHTVLIPAVEQVIGDDMGLLEQVRGDPEITQNASAETAKGWSQLWYTSSIYNALVSNLVRRSMQTEVALVARTKQMTSTIPGPIPEDVVLQWLDNQHTVMIYELTGAQLLEVSRAAREIAASTGISLDGPVVAGRPVMPTERYQVAISSAVAKHPRVAALVGALSPKTRFVQVGDSHYEPNERGSPVQIRDLVLRTLRAVRAQHPQFDAEYLATLRGWLRPAGEALEPRWTIQADSLTFSFANYGNYPGRAWLRYPGTRQTRASTPNNYSLGLRGTLSAGYDGIAIAWKNQVVFQYARTVIDLADAGQGEVTQETADDLVASTELSLKLLELTTQGHGPLSVKLTPYVNTTFDTEFTATPVPGSSATYPHQKELYGSIGLRLEPRWLVQEVRLAALTKTDFAAETGAFELGLLVGTKLAVPVYGARFKLGATLRYFPPTDSDTAEDLGLILESNAGFDVPFTRDLSLSLMADLFLFRPKVSLATEMGSSQPVERGTAASLILSAGISFDHLWKL